MNRHPFGYHDRMRTALLSNTPNKRADRRTRTQDLSRETEEKVSRGTALLFVSAASLALWTAILVFINAVV